MDPFFYNQSPSILPVLESVVLSRTPNQSVIHAWCNKLPDSSRSQLMTLTLGFFRDTRKTNTSDENTPSIWWGVLLQVQALAAQRNNAAAVFMLLLLVMLGILFCTCTQRHRDSHVRLDEASPACRGESVDTTNYWPTSGSMSGLDISILSTSPFCQFTWRMDSCICLKNLLDPGKSINIDCRSPRSWCHMSI